MPIHWLPYKSLVITPEMENRTLLLYVEQKKLMSLKVPRVITADIIDGKVKICSSHNLDEPKKWRISTITHYTWLDEPYTFD